MSAIAFFDFDGTITADDTFITFGKFALGKTGFAKKILQAAPWLILWKLGIISNFKAKEKLFGFIFKGMAADRFLCLCNEFIPEIEKSLRPETMQKLIVHQQKGDRVVIVSASIKDWIEPWARLHNINEVLATEAEVDAQGRLSGRFSTLNCHGQEKVRRINLALGDLTGTDTFAYGDSRGDDAMLALAKHSVRV